MVGDRYDAVAASLRAKAITFHEKKKPPTGPPNQATLTYEKGDDRVTLDFQLWPDSPTAPESAYLPSETPGVTRRLTLTHIHVVGHNSPAAHQWRQSMRRHAPADWFYLPPGTNPRTGDTRLYPTAGYLQWFRANPDRKHGGLSPSVTFIFQADRPRGRPPGLEPTILDIFLENPYHPRTF